MNETFIPPFLYGTAWKEEETERLVGLALEAGFRGIDTANQRKHYFEEGVGAAITAAIRNGTVHRDELFLQSKFTYIDGQDERLPYDRDADHARQVRQSFESSLQHLGTERLDSYVLHGPSRRKGLSDADAEVWNAMEAIQRSGQVRLLGVSNVSLEQLTELWNLATVKPLFVQNRCYARTRWDAEVRAFCGEKGMKYQGFSLLTANARELRSRAFQQIVQRHSRTAAQVVFCFARQVGMLPLTGTSSPAHMREDLAIDRFELSPEEMLIMEGLAKYG